MKGKSKHKSITTPQNPHSNTTLYQLAFQMLVNSLNETRDEEYLVRIIRMTEILK